MMSCYNLPTPPQSVNLLAMETRRVVRGNHTRKTAAFVHACAAYCFITIPSLGAILGRLSLYLISGRVAVANGALSQSMCRGGGGSAVANG